MRLRLSFAGLGIAATLMGCVVEDSGTLVSSDAGSADVTPPPTLVVVGSTSVVDFGALACGAAAPPARTITVQNTGESALHYGLALSPTSAFAITGATSGDIAAGGTATWTIGATAVPSSEAAGAVDEASLTITTNDPTHPSTSVTLRRTAKGATLSLTPATVDFGDVPVTATSAPTAIALKNEGTTPVTVTLGAPSDPAFVLAGASGPITLAPGETAPSLAATFAPTAKQPVTASAAITTSGAICGASATSVPLRGNGVAGVVTVGPGSVAFGSVDCGKTTAAQSVTVTNSGNAPVKYTATLLAGAASPYAIAPATGTIAAGGTATITVTPKAIPAVASVAPNAFGDTLRVTSDALGDANHDVALTESAHGAVLALDKTTEPFGDVGTQTTQTLPFAITNTGNAPATVTLAATGAGFAVTPAGATPIAAGATPLAGSASFHPTATGAASGKITIATGAADVVCSAPLGPITLTGNGVNGAMAVSTKSIDFGSVFCGQATGTKTFTITNTGTASFSWTATLGKGASSPYALDVTTSTLAAGAKSTVTITPAAIPATSALTANLYGDTITITPTGIVGGTAAQIALTETAKGGIVTASPGSIPFPATAVGQSSSPATLTITNTGSAAVTLTPSVAGGNAGSFALTTPGAHALAASGGTYSPGPFFKPQSSVALSSTVALAVANGDVLCQPLPNAIALSGTGTSGALQLGAASITFPAQTCGAPASTQALKLTNNGNGALTFNAAVLGTSGFQVAPTTGTLAAGGGTTNLTITSPAFASTRGNVTPATDTLRVTTNVAGDGNHDVPLSATPSGAILSFVQGSLPFPTVQAGKTGSLPLQVKNGGNVAASVSFVLTGAGNGGAEFSFAPQGSSAAAGGQINGNATFSPTSAGLQTNGLALQVPGGTALCAALPMAIAVSGTGGTGVFGGAPTGLSFSAVTCNASTAGQSFDLTNTGTAAYDFNASIGAAYAVSPASGTVPVGGSFPVTVTPAIGSGAAGSADDATLTITTDIPGDSSHVVSVVGAWSGAAFPPQPNDVNGAPAPTYSFSGANSATQGQVVLPNTGNAAASITALAVPSPTNPDATPLQVDVANPIAPGGAATVTYTFPAVVGVVINQWVYTVYFPSAPGAAGVCSGQSVQTVTVNVNTG